MGFFDWFRSSTTNVETEDDILWLTKQAKLRGILRGIEEQLGRTDPPSAIVVVAQFKDCLADLEELFAEHPIDGSVACCLASELETLPRAGEPPVGTAKFEIVVAERHLLPIHDAAVLKHARGLPDRCRVVQHQSLDDVLMRLFAREWVGSLLSKLGMTEEDPLQSRMVTSRIKRAQRELASRAFDDRPADSAEEWVQRNRPDLWPSLRPESDCD